MDIIHIKNVEIHAKHGVLPAEKKFRQKFFVSASLFLDFRGAALADDLGLTVDYSKITLDVVDFVLNNSFNLIETLADRLCIKLLEENQLLRKVRVEVCKPEARIKADFETICVEATRSRHVAFLSLGSNIGDRESNLNLSLESIGNIDGCKVLRVSNFFNTAPYGFTKQDDFLNACVEVETFLSPLELLFAFREIEAKFGREQIVKWGPRVLDIDIVYFDDIVFSHDDLIIPHIDMHRREFVLMPLKEIAPNKRHPILLKTTVELLNELKHGSIR